jgi:adenine-specific DNA-methyltransferase
MPILKKINKYSVGENSDNLIINGDTNVVLNLLSKNIENTVKCIYIDPPYNTGESFVHYDDNSTHEVWLEQMKVYLTQLKPLLSNDGSIWISINDKEMHYLKVLADSIFGRHNFINTIIWQQRNTRENRKIFSNNHEYILVYAADKGVFKKSRNLLPLTTDLKERYKNYDNDPRGRWQSISANVQGGHAVGSQFYEIVSPSGKKHLPPSGRCWIYNEEKMNNEIKAGNIWFGKNSNGVPRIKKFLDNTKAGLTPETLWLSGDVCTTNSAKKHLLTLFPDDFPFDTPKPEQLIRKIFDIATNKGDLVFDGFLGSGTTAAVAHKMDRKYICIEKEEAISMFALKRMKKVVEGEKYGISTDVNWKGVGTYNFFKIV